jgi:hypothetical protein
MNTLTKIQIEKAKLLISYDGKSVKPMMLSYFYNSRSTNYASCINSKPFIIITDKSEIAAMGFNAMVKAVVTLETTDARVTELMAEVATAHEAYLQNEKRRSDDRDKSDAHNSKVMADFNDTERMKRWKNEMSTLNSQRSRTFAMNKLNKIGGMNVDCATAREFQRKIESVN